MVTHLQSVEAEVGLQVDDGVKASFMNDAVLQNTAIIARSGRPTCMGLTLLAQ